MAKNNSPKPTEESDSVFYKTEDRNNIQELIRPRSPAYTDKSQSSINKTPTCLSQLDGWNNHGDDPGKAINIHLSQTGDVVGLTEAPEATGGTIFCFNHPKKIFKELTTTPSTQLKASLLMQHIMKKFLM